METAVIGVDIGGTKIKVGAVSSDGRIVCTPVTVPTVGMDKKEKIFQRIARTIQSVIENSELEDYTVEGIGLGVTGPLDTKNGLILECPQLPTMHFYPLKDKICNEFHLPVFMDNDANALMLGESIWGAGKGNNIVLGYTLGTGLGCATVINNRIFTGANGMAGEIWLAPYQNGIIEDIISGEGIRKYYHRLTGKRKTAKEISQLGFEGEKMALETWATFGRALAMVISWGINMIDPNIVILGGSIANSMPLFYDSMDKYLRIHICPVPSEKTKVVGATLADNAGYIGASVLVMQGKTESTLKAS